MANDITSINSNRSQLSPNQSSSVKIRDGASSDNKNSGASQSDDRLTLTNTAAHLQNIEQKLNSGSSVDAKHVAEVQKAISNGEYAVNSDRIADKMLSFEEHMNN